MTAPGIVKRLIEADLPIQRISGHARREKESRCGHIPRLHIYPAARPIAACRAVLLASICLDPVDDQCPPIFRKEAGQLMVNWAKQHVSKTSAQSLRLLTSLAKTPESIRDDQKLRQALLDFIADFSTWENSVDQVYLDTARSLVDISFQALGHPFGTRPLVLDAFAGGGALPLEALRIGCDAFASDLNPVASLIERVVLEYIPRFGADLAIALRAWGEWITSAARDELAGYFRSPVRGEVPIVYLWARTVLSEAPGSGIPIEIPLIKTMWLAKKSELKALRWVRDRNGVVETETITIQYANGEQRRVRRPILEVFEPKVGERLDVGTVRRMSATCPVTGFTTSADRVRSQLRERKGGAADARLFCIVSTRAAKSGRSYRIPTQLDLKAFEDAKKALHKINDSLPHEPTPVGGGRGAGRAFGQRSLGLDTWADLFNPRQALALATYARLSAAYVAKLQRSDGRMADAIGSCLALIVGRLADLNSSLCAWQLSTPNAAHAFVRWAIQIPMDFAEVNPLAGAGGSPESALWRVLDVIENIAQAKLKIGTVERGPAQLLPLPDNSVNLIATDPPYYDAIPYADLMDYFFVWHKRVLKVGSASVDAALSSKDEECIVDPASGKDQEFYERNMKRAFIEARRVVEPKGIAIVVFAHKTTAGWESLLQAIVESGWTITASWPIDTEMGSRMRANASAVLASSVHLVCRPRENPAHKQSEEIGDWRDVLQELPRRIHEWMPRLAEEGIVGADAIFACLGPRA